MHLAPAIIGLFVNRTLWSVNSQESSKIDASRCKILRLQCTKFTFLQCPKPCLYLRGLLLRGWKETGEGEEKVKGKEGERWREGFGPPKNFVAPPMPHTDPQRLLCRHVRCFSLHLFQPVHLRHQV